MNTDLILFIIAAVTIIIVVILWQGMSIAKTQISADLLQSYQRLAEQSTNAAQKSADAEQKTAEVLEDMRAHLAAIEKLLSEVQ
jgi:hypothetical protein